MKNNRYLLNWIKANKKILPIKEKLYILNWLLQEKEKPILPPEYQQIEYIESTGSQYIDTGVILTKNHGFYIDFVPENDVTTTNAPNYINAGGAGGTSNRRVGINCYARTENGELQFFSWYGGPKITKNQRASLSVINRIIYFPDGSTREMNITETNPTNSSMILFAAYNQDLTQIYRFSKMKLYNLKLYNSNEVVREYIPCYRKSDGEIGLYELIEGRFLTNQGSGTFIKGKNIKR